MNYILFILFTFLLGFLTAIPIGASQIEIAKRVLNKQKVSAYMVAIGTVSSDITYGALAVFSASQLLRGKIPVAIFELAATLILWGLAYLTFQSADGQKAPNFNKKTTKSKHWSFVTGFTLSITNPMMIFWWVMGFRFIKSLDLIRNFNITLSIIFIAAGGVGILMYLFLFTKMITWIKKFLNSKTLKKFYYGMAGILVLFSFYFLYHALKLLVHA